MTLEALDALAEAAESLLHAALPAAWLLGALRLWVCFACLPWLRGLWWGWAAGVALAALTIGAAPEAGEVGITAATILQEVLTGLVLGLSARALCLAGRALAGLLEGGLPGRAPLRVSGALWFAALLILQGGHVALMQAAALSLRWLPVGASMTAAQGGAMFIGSVGAAWALAAGLALPLLFAAATLEISLGVAYRVSLISIDADAPARGAKDGLQGELLRWVTLWALVTLCAQAVGPWWIDALTHLKP